MDTLSRSWGRPCRTCGQHHARHEPHVYDYCEDVDEDLTCHICLQPLVGSLDTPCGHTFCGACLVPYLNSHQNCPICRAALTTQACRSSPLVLQKILEKLLVKCPHADQCKETAYPRGDLEDHLKNRCQGNFIACRYATHGCLVRGPQKAVHKHQTDCEYSSNGITRLPIIEGEISHIEIPRTATNLGMTIVGGADTPLRCVVIQEVFPDSLVAQDGRLQPGDQIVEVNGVDMTNASHKLICQALKVQTPVLQLGVYREKIDPPPPSDDPELHTVTLEKAPGQTLGVKLVSRRADPAAGGSGGAGEDGVHVAEVIDGSAASQDARLRRDDRILYINGRDVRHGRLQLACELIQNNSTVSLVISRPSDATAAPATAPARRTPDAADGLFRADVPAGLTVSHARTKSAPDRLSQGGAPPLTAAAAAAAAAAARASGGRDEPDRMAMSRRARGESMDHLSAPDPPPPPPLPAKPGGELRRRSKELRRSLRIESDALQQKTVTIAKNAKESLGLRIGGGIHCNEGDTPIYIANINHQGPVGKSKQVKKGDILLSVNGRSLVGLTHAQAVAALKSTAELPGVTLSVLEGPESSRGPAKFIPSWIYWQTLPRCLCYPRGVELSRGTSGSLGFSIVGGCDGGTRDPIHVLFVVQNSPAAVEGKLRCGDRLLAVDGHTLEGVRHAEAVSLLKQARLKVKLQVVSWMGTEL